MNRQTEQVNAMLKNFLQYYITASQRNWMELLDTAQFTHDFHKSSSTGKSPFKVVLGRQPLTPLDIAQRNSDGSCPAAHRLARECT